MPLVNQDIIVFRPRGIFSNSTTYRPNDWMALNGIPYIASMRIAAGNPPNDVDNPTNGWARFGDSVIIGPRGLMGLQGNSIRAIFIHTSATPPTPTGTWDGTNLTLTGGWDETYIVNTAIPLYRAEAILDNVANTVQFTAPQLWTGPVGPEPSTSRLNSLIGSALSAAIVADEIQTQAGVLQLIADYLAANDYLIQDIIQDLINNTLTSIIATDGLIQVEYSTDQVDWEPTLATYRYVRIRGSNPNAPWFVLDLGIVSSGGGGGGTVNILVEYSATGTAPWSTTAISSGYFRMTVGTGTPSSAIPFGTGGAALQQADSTEILEATETATRAYSPSQLPEIVQDHETYPWAHSQRITYSTTPSPGITSFQILDVGATRYITFSDVGVATHFGLYLNELERHDEFAIVTMTDKDELYRGEIDEDYDETNTRIEVLEIPDATPLLVDGTEYFIEFTRSIPDVGFTEVETQDQVIDIVEQWALARHRNTSTGLLEDFTPNDTPIPLDKRYQNMPIVWEQENTAVEYYETTTTTVSSTALQIKIETIGNNTFLQVPSTSQAGTGFFSGLKQYDIVSIYNFSGNFESFLIAEADWDATNGLQVREVWNDLGSTEDFDAQGNHVEVRHTRSAVMAGAASLEYQYSPDRNEANAHDPPIVAATDFYGRFRTVGSTVWSQLFSLIDTTAGATAFHHVEPSDVSATPGLITVTIAGITTYTEGLQIGFQMPGVINTVAPEVQINMLGARTMVKNSDLLGFGTGELEPDSYLRLVYIAAASKFITNIPADYNTVFVLSPGVSQIGNEITLQPTFTPGSSSSIAYKFVPKSTNTGDVTILVNDIGIDRKSLRKQDGSQFAAGELPVGLLLAVVYDQTNDYYWTGNYNGPVTASGTANVHKVLPANVTGTADAIELAIAGVTAYTDGMEVQFFSEAANTSAITVQIGSLGFKSIVKEDGSPFAAGQLTSGYFLIAIYDSTNDNFVANVLPASSSAVDGVLNTADLSAGTLTMGRTAGLGDVTVSGFTELTGGAGAPTNTTAIVGRSQLYVDSDTTVSYYSLSADSTWTRLGHILLTTGASAPTAAISILVEAIYFRANGEIYYSEIGETTWTLSPSTGGSGGGIPDWVSGTATTVGNSVFDTDVYTAFRCITNDPGTIRPSQNNTNFVAHGAGTLVETDRSFHESNRCRF